MADNAVLLKPVQRAIVTTFGADDVRSITMLNGFFYGIKYTNPGTGSTTLYKAAPFGAGSTIVISSVQAVKDITNDGTYLYAVEERTGASGAITNQLVKIDPATGATTVLASTMNSARSVVYDPVNICLYIAFPFDNKIMIATGGGIGGNTDTFNLSNFTSVTIANGPGRMWLNQDSTILYFTLDGASATQWKQQGIMALEDGVPDTPSYFNTMGGKGESTCLMYMDTFDVLIYAGPNATTGEFIGLDLFSYAFAQAITTRFGQGIIFAENDFAIPDGVSIRYYDITQ